ncbi:MAG TPA: hypothetical protein ENN72_04080 [Firmicutes bacterium]|nr:hypothetical protein [Bacillota bacterium]
MEHYFKIFIDWRKDMYGPYEAFFSSEMLQKAAIEDYEALMDLYGADPDAWPEGYPISEGTVRLSFFAESHREALMMQTLLQNLLPEGVRAEREEGDVSLFPRRVLLTDTFHVLVGDEIEPIPGEPFLRLSGSQIFGTGEHETTRLMARMMERQSFKKARVIDAGAGSCILTLFAAYLGAESLYAFDIAPNFQETAVRAMELNGKSFHAFQEDHTAFTRFFTKWDDTRFFLANMLPRYLFPLLETFGEKLSPDTIVLLSGIPEKRREESLDFFKKIGLDVMQKDQQGKWLSFTGRFL